MPSPSLLPLLFFLLFQLAFLGKGIQFKVENEVEENPNSFQFGKSDIKHKYATRQMKLAYHLIVRELTKDEDDAFDKKNVAAISLRVVRENGLFFQQSQNEITVSEEYFHPGDDENQKEDLKRNIYRAMTRVFLWMIENEGDEEFKSGIANFILLRANIPFECRARRGEGSSWTQDSDVTAQFLNYCEDTESYYVRRLLLEMRTCDAAFANEYVEPKWREYKERYSFRT